ncbi:arylsulfatase [Novosphingobium sp. SG751A]|uniref:arylsulfatase n=1 Tax=Novosphingobium sp. SG751A TaxID=2587000 RepID=UPI0015580A6C|nr:arylsulfatase [Novosphingobium sp. SG751A]NOW45764.1 arylsulfatase [Novosphingobium sp. SG751A]
MHISRRHFVGGLMAASALSQVAAAASAKPARRPNIITIVLDDVGYSDLGCFGSEIRTPAMDSIAQGGLRYVRFDTKAVCAATRAALMTGRNSHSVNMPDVPDVAGVMRGDPEAQRLYRMPQNAQTVAQALRDGGYATWAIGKWHLIPMGDLPPGASREHWPLQRGFDYFYGFPRGWTDQYKPELVENDGYIHPDLPQDYHLSADLANRAISLIERQPQDKPFYLNLAFGTAHAPLQVPREWSRPYDALYTQGWDAIRKSRYERMKKMGIIPQETLLPPREAQDRAWTSLSDDEREVFARYMAVYAGFIEHCDHQIGRVLDSLRRLGQLDNTLIVLISDNGAAAEAGQEGEFDGLYKPNTLTPAQQKARIDELGTGKTQAEYPRPWAYAGTTPLRRYKLWPFSGGTRTPLIVHWPAMVRDPGHIRRQFVDVVDIAPTLLEAAGAGFAPRVGNVVQMPVAGRSFLATLGNPAAPGRQVQYFELRGNRAITNGPWRALAIHNCGAPYAQDKWQLYNIDRDFSESTDLAARHPDIVRKMTALWEAEWQRHVGRPLPQPVPFTCAPHDQFDRAH